MSAVPGRRSEPRGRQAARCRRLVAAGALVGVAAIVVVAAFAVRGDDPQGVLVPREDADLGALLAYDDSDESELESRAALGLSQPLYAKSPGGVIATARRTESFRDLVEDAVADSGFDADLVEAIVFLESGGRPDVVAGDDPVAASGLTQILAETAQSFLAMSVVSTRAAR